MFTLMGALYVLHFAVAAYLIVGVLRSRSEPSAMVAWILIILVVPIAGSGTYAMLGESRIAMRADRKRRRRYGVDEAFAAWLRTHLESHESFGTTTLPEALAGIATTGRKLAGSSVTTDNGVEVIASSEDFHQRLLAEIRGARRNLNILFYIWNPDDSGGEVLDAVIERARSGVACRILLDAAGSVHVPRRFLNPAKEAGVSVAFFMPLRPTTRRFSVHLRNHRKIVVVDGETALVGSQNVGDCERGCGHIRPYQQVSLLVRGPAVRHLQAVFAGDWNASDNESLCEEAYFPAPQPAGSVSLQVVATGPDQPYHVVERILMEALASAKESVWIATPYFVPSETLRLALGQASIRGVSVNLVVPGKTDRAPALWAGRSFYGELLTEGVAIHEYSEGMLHSKLVAVDNAWCMAGTANMDFRSFRLNFEISVLGYDDALATEIAEIVRGYVAESKQVTVEAVCSRSLGQQLLAGAARLLASQL